MEDAIFYTKVSNCIPSRCVHYKHYSIDLCTYPTMHLDFGLQLRGGAIGDRGAKAPLKIQRKGKILKYGVFSYIKVIKISFSVIFNEEIRALEGLLSQFFAF